MEGAPNQSIKWGLCREGVLSQLQKFDSLPQDGLTLMQSYQTVLDNNETFTQYFSEEPLESYTLEARLKETLGIHDPSPSEHGTSGSESNPSISWVNIFRHGNFEKQPDGSYHCRDQGKLIQIDESLHKSILVHRCFLPANSSSGPSQTDIERESEITLAIEADVIDELNKKIKYVERLKRLQLSLRKRRIKLQNIQDPIKRSHTPQTPGIQYPKPDFHTKVHVRTQNTRGRSSSASSSGVSSGSDIPFAANPGHPNPISLDSGDDTSDNLLQHSKPTLHEKGKVSLGIRDSESTHFQSDGTGRSTPVFPISQNRHDTQGSGQYPKSSITSLPQPTPKKQKIETAPSQGSTGSTNLGEELAMWKAKLDTPQKPRHTSSNGPKEGTGKKRTRNNFTQYEKDHAPAWFKSQVEAGISAPEIEQAYVEKFGVFHRWLTLKLWVDRQNERANKEQPKSKIVVLKPARSHPSSRAISAAPSSHPEGAASSPYVSPYPQHPITEQLQSSSIAPNSDQPLRTTPMTPINSGLPNLY